MAKEIDIGAYSAYAIAVEHGYVGTEAEFAAQLINSAANGALAQDGAERAEAAAEEAAETLESIPEDYTTLSERAVENTEKIGQLSEEKADKINDSSIGVFDAGVYFEIDGSYIYIWWDSQFHLRGVPGRNQDFSLVVAKTQVGAENVKTSPGGKECIAISGTNWLVMDAASGEMRVIDRGTFDYNAHVMLLAHAYGIPSGGLMMPGYYDWLVATTAENESSSTDQKLALKADKTNLSFVGLFEDPASIELTDTHSFVWWGAQFHLRGVAERNVDISITQAREQVGVANVGTSPSGKNGIMIAHGNWLVLTLPGKTMSVIDRYDFDYNTMILLYAAPYGVPCGLMAHHYLQEQISNIESDDVNKNKNVLLNAKHVAGDGATLTLLHLSDLHGEADTLGRIISNAASIYGASVNDAICTGDMVPDTAEQISGWWNPAVLTCIGNHDTATYTEGSGYDWTALSMADRDAYYIAPFKENWGITHTSGTSYYYKDYNAANVRLIVMDAMLYTAGGADATAQTAWLGNLLSDAISNGLHVLIAIHAPHGGAVAVECSFSRYNQQEMPVNADCNTPQAVIDAVSAAIANGLHFVGYIVGHTHQDNVWDAEGDGKQLMYCITCASVAKAQWISSDMHRSSTSDAYNLITIDTAHTLVKLVRGGGADIDDHMRARKALCINYSTGQVAGEL